MMFKAHSIIIKKSSKEAPPSPPQTPSLQLNPFLLPIITIVIIIGRHPLHAYEQTKTREVL